MPAKFCFAKQGLFRAICNEIAFQVAKVNFVHSRLQITDWMRAHFQKKNNNKKLKVSSKANVIFSMNYK